MADNTSERREWLTLIAREFTQHTNPDITTWPDEMREALLSHFSGLSDFLAEVEENKRSGIDDNERRGKSLLKYQQLNKSRKASAHELSVTNLLQRSEQNRTLRVLVRLHGITYTSTTIDEIANAKTITEDAVLACQSELTEIPGIKLPTVEAKVLNEVAKELKHDVDGLLSLIHI